MRAAVLRRVFWRNAFGLGLFVPSILLVHPRILDGLPLRFCLNREHVVHPRSPGRTVLRNPLSIVFVLGLFVASFLLVYAAHVWISFP